MVEFFQTIEYYWDLVYQYKFTKLIIGAILIYFVVKLIKRFVHSFFKRTNLIEERQEQTLESMINSIVQYVATFGYIIYILVIFGIPVGNLLAGAGIVGIVVGLGAQSLIKDFLSGIFFLYEKQLHKGDFITVNNTFHGTVEDIGLRFLKIREWSGKLLTISNGEISTIHNFNFNQMRVIEKVTTSFYESPDKVMDALEQACIDLNRELHSHLIKNTQQEPIEKFQIYGMSALNDQFRGYEFTIIGLVNDSTYFTAAKNARLIIARTLYQNGIQMAMQHVDVRSTPES
ncbi:small-conductance mechanosensitive channel [Salirhabdus euzebyi]|uniref:Small-conductance mechanosensitive channel n=1 Tax=Salirhabdus euzebyi TaxID=394506 RepID=A0A841QAI5_9BACI|nr:mechanosensitive ion channel family protein [Salirhabdus euzebyi]MBB6455385.1 small-conductance mechanosensitive channel [Salirhabdus euzebyi]